MKYEKYWFHFNPEKRVKSEKNFRLSRGVAGGFWTKFEAQLVQPC
jgi:hypothetical protein